MASKSASIKKYVGTKKVFTDVSQIIDFIFEDEEEKGDVDSDMEVELGDDDNVNNIENTSDLEYEEENISATCTSHSNGCRFSSRKKIIWNFGNKFRTFSCATTLFNCGRHFI